MSFDSIISQDEMKQMIQWVKADKASDMFEISNKALQVSLTELTSMLTSLFNACMIIIIIINSYTLVTLIKSTHEELYAIYIEWTKLSEVENYSLFIQLLHAVKTIIMRLCIKLVRVDCMLENEWLSHFKLLQKLHFHHHSCSCSETLHDNDDYLIVQEVDIL